MVTTSNVTSTDAGMFAALAGFALIFILIVLAICIVYVIGLWFIFKKAGKQGWEAIIPFYNTWVLVEIAGLNWWWFLIILFGPSVLSLIGLGPLTALASLFLMFIVNYNLAKKMHQELGMVFLMTLFPVVLYPILGFSKKYKYDSSVEVSPNGIF